MSDDGGERLATGPTRAKVRGRETERRTVAVTVKVEAVAARVDTNLMEGEISWNSDSYRRCHRDS